MHARIMADTQTDEPRISTDAQPLRLTPAAVKRAQRVTGHQQLDDVAAGLGLKRLAFYRLRKGCNPRLSLALSLADQLNMPVSHLFEPVEVGTDG